MERQRNSPAELFRPHFPPRILAGSTFLASSLGARAGYLFLDLLFAYNNISLVPARNYPTAGVGQNAHPMTQLSRAGLFLTIKAPKETFVPAKY